MEVFLLLKFLHTFITILIFYIIIPNCGNSSKRNSLRSNKGRNKKTFISDAKKRCTSTKRKTSDDALDICKVDDDTLNNILTKKDRSKDLTESKNSPDNTYRKINECKSQDMMTYKKNKRQSQIVSMTDYDEEIENKLKDFLNIAEKKQNNNEVQKKSEKEIDKKFKSLKKILKINSKKDVDQKANKEKYLDKNEAKNIRTTSKKKDIKVVSDKLEKSKMVIIKSGNENTVNKKEVLAKSLYARKNKNNGDREMKTKTVISSTVQEDEKYINLVDISAIEGLANKTFDGVILDKTQQSGSLTYDDDKLEQESFKEDKLDDNKYESLAQIQDSYK